MPTNPYDGRPAPRYTPFFSTNQQTGEFGPNSAGSVANAKLEQLLRDKDPRKSTKRFDSDIYADRQKSLNRYLGNRKGGDTAVHDGRVFNLPTVSSPLKVPHSLYQSSEKTEHERSKQLSSVEKSFAKGNFEIVYSAIDSAVKDSKNLREQVLSKKIGFNFKKSLGTKKEPWDAKLSDKEHEYVHAPLHKTVASLNEIFKEENILIRLRWRTYLRDDGEMATNLFFIFPSASYEVEKGPNSWSGMGESHARDS